MALIKRQYIASVEEYPDKKNGGEMKKAYFRVGELLTFEKDGDTFQRVKFYLTPSEKFVLFDQDRKDRDASN